MPASHLPRGQASRLHHLDAAPNGAGAILVWAKPRSAARAAPKPQLPTTADPVCSSQATGAAIAIPTTQTASFDAAAKPRPSLFDCATVQRYGPRENWVSEDG